MIRQHNITVPVLNANSEKVIKQSFKYQELLSKLFAFPLGIKNLLFQITDLYCKTQKQSILNYTYNPLRALTFEMQTYYITN